MKTTFFLILTLLAVAVQAEELNELKDCEKRLESQLMKLKSQKYIQLISRLEPRTFHLIEGLEYVKQNTDFLEKKAKGQVEDRTGLAFLISNATAGCESYVSMVDSYLTKLKNAVFFSLLSLVSLLAYVLYWVFKLQNPLRMSAKQN